MLLDIFSSLDYQFSKILFLSNLVWMMSFIWLWIMFFNYYLFYNSFNYLFLLVSDLFFNNFESPNKFLFQHVFVLVYSFSFLMIFIKFWSLMPYVYGLTTNLIVGLSFGLSYWLTLQLSSMELYFNNYVSHFVSFGSPLVLAIILTYVDLVSSLVRPLTLTLRLVMNMSMGHVIFSLLGLVGSNLLFNKVFMSILVFLILLFFFIMEICVGVIQSLVFGLLKMNYLGEHA